MAWELLVPIAKAQPLYVANQAEVPWALRPWVAGAFGAGAIPLSEIGHIYGGRAARPTKPIMVFCPNTKAISFVVGGGQAEAAELEELAYAQQEQMARRPMAERMAEWRERRGYPTQEAAQGQIAESLRERGRDQIRNPSKYPRRRKPDPNRYRRLPELTERGMRGKWP